MNKAPKVRWIRFSLRAVMLWGIPYVAVCIVILTLCREPAITPGEGVPMFHWVRLLTIGVVTAVWIILFREDQRVRQSQNVGTDPPDDSVSK